MLNREDIALLPGLLTQVVRFNERVFSADVMTCEVMMPVLVSKVTLPSFPRSATISSSVLLMSFLVLLRS